jgi:hypothetical protein
MYYGILEEIRKQRKDLGLSNQPPASPRLLSTLRDRAQDELGAPVPEGYVRFLSLSDGLVWNGLELYANETVPLAGYSDHFVQGFVDANLAHRDVKACRDLLIFGEANIDLYAYNIHHARYLILDRTSLDVTEEPSSFEDLLRKALEAHL